MKKNKKYIYIAIGLIGLLYKLYTKGYINNNIIEKDSKLNTGFETNWKKSQNNSDDSNFDFLPKSNGEIVKHKGYTLAYSEKHEQAEWVAYSLKATELVNKKIKRPYFEIDKKVKSGAASWKNYKKSGYDKGHLCPAADRENSVELFNETFLTSNISPQKHKFNAGIWNRLEQKTRYWAKKHKQLYVICGGILTGENLKKIGREKVTVPNYFYKILLDYTEPEIKAIAFLIPHQDSEKSLFKFTVTIDEIEKLTGIDFFPKLNDKVENELESSTNYKKWLL